jgi:peroxiredoxin
VAEVTNIKKMYDTYHDRGFEVVGISLDQNEAAPIKFMEERKLPWACIFDKKDNDSMSTHYGIFFIPLPILVDRKGRVVSTTARGSELEHQLQELLASARKN